MIYFPPSSPLERRHLLLLLLRPVRQPGLLLLLGASLGGVPLRLRAAAALGRPRRAGALQLRPRAGKEAASGSGSGMKELFAMVLSGQKLAKIGPFCSLVVKQWLAYNGTIERKLVFLTASDTIILDTSLTSSTTPWGILVTLLVEASVGPWQAGLRRALQPGQGQQQEEAAGPGVRTAGKNQFSSFKLPMSKSSTIKNITCMIESIKRP